MTQEIEEKAPLKKVVPKKKSKPKKTHLVKVRIDTSIPEELGGFILKKMIVHKVTKAVFTYCWNEAKTAITIR